MKPKLVIIGEWHAYGTEEIFSLMDLMKRREITTLSGRRRFIPVSRHPGTKLRVKSIVDNIIRKEADILRENCITRLLIELPRTHEYLSAFSEYRNSRDLSILKDRMQKIHQASKGFYYDKAMGLLLSMKAGKQILAAANKWFRQKRGSVRPTPIFFLSQLNSAKRAGVFDIEPIEDHEANAEALALSYLLDAIPEIRKQAAAPVQRVSRLFASPKPDEDAMRGLDEVSKQAYLRLAQCDHDREELMARNITDNYTPGSAVLTGGSHVANVRKILSARFDIIEYKVSLPDSVLF